MNFAYLGPFANIAYARNPYSVYSMNPRKFSPSKISRYTVSLSELSTVCVNTLLIQIGLNRFAKCELDLIMSEVNVSDRSVYLTCGLSPVTYNHMGYEYHVNYY